MEHPHIAHEAASIVCLRHDASYAVASDALEEWVRHRGQIDERLVRVRHE